MNFAKVKVFCPVPCLIATWEESGDKERHMSDMLQLVVTLKSRTVFTGEVNPRSWTASERVSKAYRTLDLPLSRDCRENAFPCPLTNS